MSKKPEWISEEEAAKMLNYSRRYLRHLVKSGVFSISHRNNWKGRNWEYDRKDIEALKNKNVILIY